MLGADDTLFLYTDGLIDCENAQQEQFGKNRAKDLLVQLMQSEPDLENVRNQLIENFTAFIEGKTIADDITFALVKPQ